MGGTDAYFAVKLMTEQIIGSMVVVGVFGFLVFLIVDEMLSARIKSLRGYTVHFTLMLIFLVPPVYVVGYWLTRLGMI